MRQIVLAAMVMCGGLLVGCIDTDYPSSERPPNQPWSLAKDTALAIAVQDGADSNVWVVTAGSDGKFVLDTVADALKTTDPDAVAVYGHGRDFYRVWRDDSSQERIDRIRYRRNSGVVDTLWTFDFSDRPQQQVFRSENRAYIVFEDSATLWLVNPTVSNPTAVP